MIIETRVERKRGCGYRRPGGIYLVGDGVAAPCGRLPLPLHACPTCGGGIHPARGWTWVDAALLASTKACEKRRCPNLCPLKKPEGRAGLLWVGSVFYPTPLEFTREAAQMGVSRRISQIPKDFEIGVTWVWLAHRQAVQTPCPDCPGSECEACGGGGMRGTPGVFTAFRPSRIEYVVANDDTEEKLKRLVERGFTLVRVIRDVDYAPLFDGPTTANGVLKVAVDS